VGIYSTDGIEYFNKQKDIMKKALFILIAVLATQTTTAQNILIVDNTEANPSGSNYYSDLQEAIDASVSGDIIHVLPSPISYGSVDIEDKERLTLIGLGYNTSAINKNFNYGSDLRTVDVDNSSNLVFKGLQIHNLSLDNPNSTDPSSTIVVQGSVLGSITAGFVQGLTVSNSYIDLINLSYNDNTAIIFRRCIINPAGSSDDDIRNANFHNSIFFDLDIGSISNSTFKNNIFLKTTDFGSGVIEDNNNTFLNNFFDITLPLNEGSNFAENNVVNEALNPTDIFADTAVSNSTNVFDMNWDVTPKLSSLLNAGTDGTHIGPSGGVGTYSNSLFSLPYVYDIIIPTEVKAGEDIEVTIKAKGN
tara:strand:- start:60 stop:1145 length:1086 start_codon:yes stop_codon:yes gene_type:complete